MRESARTLIEVTCQRGGQAVASLMILALLSFNGNTAVIAALILVSVAISIFNTSGLGKHYLNVFRGTLGQIGNNTRISSSELDMASLETLIAALNRPEDQEVLGAMEILAGKGRGRLIPALILYHPSPLVVIRALEIFIQDERDDFIPMVDKLIDHPDPMVRSAAVRTRAAAVPDRQWLQKRRNHECLAVDVTVVANLVARDWIEPEEAKETLYKAVHSEDPEPRVALAKAAQAVSHAVFEQPLRKLINDKVSEVRIEAIRAVSHAGAVGYLSELVPLLADRAVRETVRQALLGAGEPALQYLDACLSDPSTTPEVRRHIPRTISRFPVEAAARILLKHLPTVSGGMVRYKILRGLGKLINRDPDLKLDREVLRRVLEINLKRNYQLLQWRLDLEKGQAKEAFSLTSSGRLLVQLLRDKEHYAIERLFRLLDLLHPHEDIRRIYRGLHSLNPQVRSSSLELLGNLLSPPYRLTVMGLVDATDDQQRLVAAEHILPSRSNDYAEVVRRLLKNESHALRALAIYHAVELNLIGLEDSAAVMDLPGNGHLGRLREHVLAMLAAKSCAGDKGPSQ
jgi:HEAT repeat protein